jgi:hypothetical protein
MYAKFMLFSPFFVSTTTAHCCRGNAFHLGVMMSTVSATFILCVVLVGNDSSSSLLFHRSHRRIQTPLFTFNTSLFPNSSGPFNRSFGIGGQQPNHPKSPLSSFGGVFNGISSSGNIGSFNFNSTPFDKLLEADFGIDFPIKFSSPQDSTQSPTGAPQRPSVVPTLLPTKLPSKRPSFGPTKSPTLCSSILPTQAPVLPSPRFFFGQDSNPTLLLPVANLDIPISRARENEFVASFDVPWPVASLQQNFENSTAGDIGPFSLSPTVNFDIDVTTPFFGVVIDNAYATRGVGCLKLG